MEIIIAGDIIGSQKNKPKDYIKSIELILKAHSEKNMYQIYRGDSFQARTATPEMALLACIKLKAALRTTGQLDVRIAIGLGDLNLVDNDIAKSTGSALTRSGKLLDTLKDREHNLMVTSPDGSLDEYMNTALRLALLYMDNWTENSAAIVYEIYNNSTYPDKNPSKRISITQADLGKKLKIKQATVSRRIDRAHVKETDALLHLFNKYFKDVKNAAAS